jgi:hypothetical protein
MLRIPGSMNSKNGQQVRILQKWDGQRPYINWILKDFQRYLIQKKIRGPKRNEEQELAFSPLIGLSDDTCKHSYILIHLRN